MLLSLPYSAYVCALWCGWQREAIGNKMPKVNTFKFIITLICGHKRGSFHKNGKGKYYCSECSKMVERDETIPGERVRLEVME